MGWRAHYVGRVGAASLVACLLVLGGSVTLFLLICGAPGTSAFFLLSALHLTTGWFLAHGVLKIFMAIAVRKITTWPIVLVSGIVSMVLAFVILAWTPKLGHKIVGIKFGADLAFTGMALLLISIMGFLGKANRSVFDVDLVNEPFLQGNGGAGSA